MTNTTDTTIRLRNLINAGYSGLFVTSHEEQRVEMEMLAVANSERFTLYSWTRTAGLVRQSSEGIGVEKIQGSSEPLKMLEKFLALPERSIVMAADFHLYFESGKNDLLIRMTKDALNLGSGSNRVLAIVGCAFHLPPELEKMFTPVEFKLPDRATLSVVLDGFAATVGLHVNGDREPVLDASSGLTCREALDAYALAFIETGKKAICPSVVSRMKSSAVKKSGILEIVETSTEFSDVGGLLDAKAWLGDMASSFSKEAKAYGLPTPKGVLCIGVQGAGKTMLAKATAKLFGMPLLKLDGGKLFGSLVGSSEANVRKAIQTAEAVSPCVLMIDELDKALVGSKSSGMTDGGTSARVLGTFLSWLQDKTAPVFVFATANDISQLPPELLRKGRWDEMFFMDLPNDSERADIWRIHIERNGRKASDYDVPLLVQQSIGWTGAEIETAYVGAMRLAFKAKQEPHEGKHLETAVNSMVPISRTMAEEITKLRNWAQGRCRMASTIKPQSIGIAGPSRKVSNN